MTEFERVLVQSFNSFFTENGIKGIAHRIKQHRFTPQFLDVLVDSLDPDYYIGIECKSISVEKGAKALYYSQHFTVDKKGTHQIARISDFLRLSGRVGFLAVELRMGTGNLREAYIIPWTELDALFNTEGEKKLSISDLKEYAMIEREGNRYRIDPAKWKAGRVLR
ncbi:MAG: hypothetical protein WBL02_02640 [Methanomethylovorans sp.]|uniref:hypothetical protein n=1 Tax=Methanomethylovorans sp. TaxID=2758717 RepID=UPI000AB06E55|nr:hypothetical protein [Methanomethylovorans sp.]